MPQLIEYPAWVGQVNAELSRLSAGLFSAQDFDYPWIEKFMADVPAADAAQEALRADGFVVERLPAPIMQELGGAPCPTA
ncbi:MAG: hypothetical protein HS126_40390 [Anaerolineales bacterium]|nr:hypothetical protein [Anaerolineales bacterium]